MATKSFLKDIVITDRKDAKSFVEALENAEEKASQKKTSYEGKQISDKETIKNMFIYQHNNNFKEKDFNEKIAEIIFTSLIDVETNNQEEKSKKEDMILILNKLILNYDEIKPILIQYFDKGKDKQR